MAVRYDQKTKDEVVAFIENHNKENGRGGQSAAAEKYGVSPITIANWLRIAGVKSPNKRAKAGAKVKRGGGRPPKKTVVDSPTSVRGILERMGVIQKEIDSLQAEFDALKGKL